MTTASAPYSVLLVIAAVTAFTRVRRDGGVVYIHRTFPENCASKGDGTLLCTCDFRTLRTGASVSALNCYLPQCYR